MFQTLKRRYSPSVPEPSPTPTPTATATPTPTPTPNASVTPTPTSTPTPTPTPSFTSTPTPTPTPTSSPPPAPAPPRTYATIQMSRQNPLNRSVNFITTTPAFGTTTQRLFNGTVSSGLQCSANATYFNYWKLGSSNMQFLSPYTATSNPTYVIVTNGDTSTKLVIAYFK